MNSVLSFWGRMAFHHVIRGYAFIACLSILCLFSALLPAASLGDPADLPASLRHVGIDQRLNDQIPFDLTFRDETGKTVRLGEYFGTKPVILNLVYFDCPMLCPMELDALVRSLRGISLRPARDFEIVTVSFNPREGPDLAAQKKAHYMKNYGHPEAAAGWHFLTGEEPQIEKLAKAVGFRYVYDEKAKQYSHAMAIMVATSAGKLSRYFYGVDYPPMDLRLGLVEASHNRIGSPIDYVLLFCCHYDPAAARYTVSIMRVMRAAAAATVLAIGGFLFVMLRKERAVKS